MESSLDGVGGRDYTTLVGADHGDLECVVLVVGSGGYQIWRGISLYFPSPLSAKFYILRFVVVLLMALW